MSCEEGREAAFTAAKKEGLEIVFPDSNQLFIDIDSDADFEAARKLLKQFKALHDIKKVAYKRSQSGNYHLYVTMGAAMNDVQRIAMQAIFRSDPKREALSMKALLQFIPQPTVFFTVPKNPMIPMEI